VEIVNVCRSLALKTIPTEVLQVWRMEVWSNTALMGQKSRAVGLEIPWHMEQWLHRPMRWGLACSTCYSFSIWCGGEDFQELGVQSANVSALPGVLPHSHKPPTSCQSPWITEVRRSVAVFWSPFGSMINFYKESIYRIFKPTKLSKEEEMLERGKLERMNQFRIQVFQ
jgi:hypothetical protein